MNARTFGDQFAEATDRLLPALDALAERHGLAEHRERLRELGTNPYIRTNMDPQLTALLQQLALAIIAETLLAHGEIPSSELRAPRRTPADSEP